MPSLEWVSVSHSVMFDSVTPLTVAHQEPLSMEFSRQEYYSGLLFPSPGDLPNPGTELLYWVSCITGRFFTTEPPGNLVPSLEICNLAFCKVYFSFVGWSFHLLCDFFKLKHIHYQKKGMIPEWTEVKWWLTSSSFLIFEIEQNSMFKPHYKVHLFWDEKNDISCILD